MDKKAWSALLVASLALAAPCVRAQSPSNPSFDCRKATTPVEKLICGDPKLGEFDRKMAETFRQALEKAPAADRDAIVKRQFGWLQDRGIGCGLDPRQPAFRMLGAPPPAKCLAGVYEGWLQNMQVLIVAPYVPPGRTELPFEAKRHPFLPRLLVSHEEKLCEAFLRGLRRDFLARHRDFERPFKQPTMALGHWVALPWGPLAGPDRTSIAVAEVDLDQDGKKQLLLHVAKFFNIQRNSYYLLIRSNTTTDGLMDEVKDIIELSPERQRTPSLRHVEVTTFRNLNGGDDTPYKLLSYQGALYAYTAADGIVINGTNEVNDGTAVLRRIHADGSTELRCEASIAPRAGALPLPPWQPTKPPETISVPAQAVEWMRTIREIQGTEGKWPGSLHSLNRLINWSAYAWHDALVRPWEVTMRRPTSWPSALAIRSWLHQWGYQSLSQFRLVRAFEAGRGGALDALAEYYERAFGVPNSKETAAIAIDSIISSSFVISGLRGADEAAWDGLLRQQLYELETGRAGSPANLLRPALLIGASPGAIDAMIKAGATLGGATESGEPALF
jgi:uncharacterized protein YecT (DUF1311 family)